MAASAIGASAMGPVMPAESELAEPQALRIVPVARIPRN